MTEEDGRIDQLKFKLAFLEKRHNSFSKEIDELRKEIKGLNNFESKRESLGNQELTQKENLPEINPQALHEFVPPIIHSMIEKSNAIHERVLNFDTPQSEIKLNIEKFIGENLINKIGIIITVIGVAIGAKYSIEHELISPLTRIILGYLMGIGLLGFGIKLKANYLNFSAVLVSGAIAILYFITYAAYGFYDLMPQLLAFGLMTIFTVFAVLTALHYNNQVIAHIGLVGAYAVPFLLSDGSGKVGILFSYMTIVNIGILVIAFKKYWKPLSFVAFILTWLIYYAWFSLEYVEAKHFRLSLVFLSMFFAIFYEMGLMYKLIQKEKFLISDIILIVANAFLFYGLGYTILSSHDIGKQLLGVFTLINAIIHFSVSVILYRNKLADRNLFYLIVGLVLTFITIAIPVQLEGNWVTLFWIIEAALLFWIGRSKQVYFYEVLSYPLIFLAFFSLVQDWSVDYSIDYTTAKLVPIVNIHFLSSLLFIAAMGFINFIHSRKRAEVSALVDPFLKSIINFSIPAIFLIAIYASLRYEITAYFDQLYADSEIAVKAKGESYNNLYYDYDIIGFKNLWLLIYTTFFTIIASFVNLKKFKNKTAAFIGLMLSVLLVMTFITFGLMALGDLKDNYINQTHVQYHKVGFINIGMRYILFLFLGSLLFTIYKVIKSGYLQGSIDRLKKGFDLFLSFLILVVASNEIITWMDINLSPQSYKLGLSLLWGIYALALVTYGIWKNKIHLRICGIILFAITLAKLFFFDLTNLDTIAKTILFVSLGILLLIISFLYNKFKDHMS